MTLIMDGKAVANKIKNEIKEFIALQVEDNRPCLATIMIGNNQESTIYVNNKMKSCNEAGIQFVKHHLSEDVSEQEVINLIDSLNHNKNVNGILVQLPLPKHLDEKKVLSCIDPTKDVDGFHAVNIGKFNLGDDDAFMPCTPLGICEILKYYNIDISGKECVVVGRSDIVGKPMANALLHMDGTVTICHSKTKNLKDVCKRADILICAIGKPKFFNKDYIKEDAVVIDVGINRNEDGKLCGDVDFDDVKDIVSAITPVPGGVGPMTVAMLMSNCVKAACNQGAIQK